VQKTRRKHYCVAAYMRREIR